MVTTNFNFSLHSAIAFFLMLYRVGGHNWYDLFSMAKNGYDASKTYRVKRSRLRSTSEAPIPGTCCKSSSVLKGPYSSR
ncbi:MAG TPA: hypothetical protein DCX28_00975 [Enterobacteriaceae bacterium]|nr:hypothetical protein [Enterobacteriaceae bacterium]